MAATLECDEYPLDRMVTMDNYVATQNHPIAVIFGRKFAESDM